MLARTCRPAPVLVALCALAASAGPAGGGPLGEGHSWDERIPSARAYALERRGRVAFAVVDERGRVRPGLRSGEHLRSASITKAMLLVAYLSSTAVRDRPLRAPERALIGEMIRHSGNRAASRIHAVVGNVGLAGVARRAGMRAFVPGRGWSSARVTAADQARLFFRIDRLVPPRHRDAAREELTGVIRSQRWGIPAAVPAGFTVAFKGAWRREGPGRLRLVHQVALVERGGTRFSIAVLSDLDPSHRYGTRTIQGIARKLLHGAR